MRDQGYDASLDAEEDDEVVMFDDDEEVIFDDDEEEEVADSWPQLLPSEYAKGEFLGTLPPSYRWAKWILRELSSMEALADPNEEAHREVLNLQFLSGVLLNGDLGNGQRLIARSIIRHLGRVWIRLTRRDWRKESSEASLEKLRQCLKDNRGRKLCLWIEDLSYCRYAEELADFLADYADEFEPQTFYMVVLEDEWKIPRYLRQKLLTCAFWNPDERERDEYLRIQLKAPQLVLTDESRKMLLEKTDGFSYSDMEQLLHWLRLMQRDILIKKYPLNANAKLRAMEEDAYISLLEECEISPKDMEDLIGLLRKSAPAGKAAVPLVIMQSSQPSAGQQPVQQEEEYKISAPDQKMSLEKKEKYYKTQYTKQINSLSYDDQWRVFDATNQKISNGGGMEKG